jgi:hypothetical protein
MTFEQRIFSMCAYIAFVTRLSIFCFVGLVKGKYRDMHAVIVYHCVLPIASNEWIVYRILPTV